MTCKSCIHYRLNGCDLGIYGWPMTPSVDCPSFVYFPGSDEAEDELPDL